jgi:hypothetical protein
MKPTLRIYDVLSIHPIGRDAALLCTGKVADLEFHSGDSETLQGLVRYQ